MSRTIAPTLAWGVRNGIISDPYARRELRALLAVARAGCMRHPTYKAIRKPTAVCPGCNALYRLRSLSAAPASRQEESR